MGAKLYPRRILLLAPEELVALLRLPEDAKIINAFWSHGRIALTTESAEFPPVCQGGEPLVPFTV